MFHTELINANVQAMTEQRLREVQNLRAARQARAEERAERRARRREERRGHERPWRRKGYDRAA
ncbi:hypothetical protein [Nocardiopsis halotolerans]|uniref:hypothetical protein n=1 Tax=Nocardiopsis halotolerans TaxID=124252 RepID=UPI000374E987|nr:hypothetical protein [Nocardiopsis halotolerans]